MLTKFSTVLSFHKNNFNFLRLLAACAVIFSHCYDVVGKSEDEPVNIFLQNKLAASGIGLCIFFFISGFFVSKSAIESESVLSFLKKRVLRIYPALIIVVLLTVFVLGPLMSELDTSTYFKQSDTWKYLYTGTGIRIRQILPGVFTNTNYFRHGINASIWTISCEIYLYLFLAIFILFAFLKNKMAMMITSIIICISCLGIGGFCYNYNQVYHKYLNFAAVFFLGSFIYSYSPAKKSLLLVLGISLFTFIITLIYPLSFFKNETALFIAICILTYLIGYSKKIKIWLTNDISYGIYIIAFPIQQLIFRYTNFNRSILLQLFLTFIVCIPIAYLSWKYIEKPFLQIAHKNQKKAQ